MGIEGLISAAKGDSPSDLLLTNARIINTFTGEIEKGNVAIWGGKIAGIGDYHRARQSINLRGKYLAPGFINGHTHVESSMLTPAEYARAVVPRGTLAVVTDLHEIANVCGLTGMRYILDSSQALPLDLFLMAPSCIPATNMETAGAYLGPDEVRTILNWEGVIGLGEVMDFPGVLAGDKEILLKIALARSRTIDGHAPGLRGRNLQAYIAAGISSDHESTALEEAREKLQRGMYIMLREGSSEKNLEALLPLVNDSTYHRCFFVVDDRSPLDLWTDGDIDAVVRKAITLGLDPVRAVQMATINTANYFHLDGIGAIAPGYDANLIVIDDLPTVGIELAIYRGELVARDGKLLPPVENANDSELRHSINIGSFEVDALKIYVEQWHYPIIEIVPGQIVTKKLMADARTDGALVVPDIERDILKAVVVERHKATGNIGRGLVKGFGLRGGALASSISHDSHNIIAVGVSDNDIFTAVKEIEKLGGGLVVTAGSKILTSLPLPIAGLLSDEPIGIVVDKLAKLQRSSEGLGCSLPHPFAVLSFLALPVIPQLRLTDRGLVDVEAFRLLDGSGNR